jgi:predicted RNA binding protein YcfA (HicA-like mRNA interferase family)
MYVTGSARSTKAAFREHISPIVTVIRFAMAFGARYNCAMPRKIRELIRDLERAGFTNRGGKGSHRNFEHPRGLRTTLSGNLGDDAKPYQEREVKRIIEESKS